jgi:aminopeptidase N
MTVDAVRTAPESLQFVHERDRLRIALAPASRAGELRDITVSYHGVPATGLIIRNNRNGSRCFFSDNWPNKAREWLPTVDHPYDKATSELVVTAPAHYQVVSNGLLVEETDLPGGQRRTSWRQAVPIATWLNTLGVARFAVRQEDAAHGIPVQSWVFAEERDAGFVDFPGPTRDVLEFFSDRIGPFPYAKLANVQSNSVSGAMESATAIFYDDDAVTGKREVRWRNVMVHEIAHQWWGNAVTERDWDDVWLSEGFATYFTLLFIEHRYGRDEFVAGLKESRDRVRAFDAEHPDYRIVHDNLADMTQVLTPQIYQKGAWTLHMLRGLIGDEAFWEAMRRYYARYRDANASTAEFRQVVEEVAGQQFGWFFNQWLTRGGYPRVEATWRYDAATHAVVVHLRQAQNGAPYRFPLDVAVSAPGEPATRITRTEVDGREMEIRVPSEKPPTSVVLDPNTWMLMDARLSAYTPQ